jgi:hypothetical protein
MDLVHLVGWRVLAGDLLDYVRFRAVCAHWRSSTVSPLGRGIVDPRFHPRRWMILPEGHGVHPGDGKKRFLNLSTGAFARVRLPLLTEHRVLVSAEGLLLLGPYSRRDTGTILILHPFTGDSVKLPPLMPLLESYWAMLPGMGRHYYMQLDFVASLSVSADGTVAVMIVHQDIPCVLFATTKDEQWRASSWDLAPLSRPISFQGRLYILTPPATHGSQQLIMLVGPPRHEHATMPSSLAPPKLIATCPKGKYHHRLFLIGLAECDSQILAIGFEELRGLFICKVADLTMGKVSPMPSIGGNTIFLIERSTRIQSGDIIISRSMTSSCRVMPTVQSDTIVCRRQNYPWQYHLGTGNCSRIMCGCGVQDGYTIEGGCNCGLIYHIYHCCHCPDDWLSTYVFKV